MMPSTTYNPRYRKECMFSEVLSVPWKLLKASITWVSRVLAWLAD
jgi:hypothetical protein